MSDAVRLTPEDVARAIAESPHEWTAGVVAGYFPDEPENARALLETLDRDELLDVALALARNAALLLDGVA